jgi:hypothetical protein
MKNLSLVALLCMSSLHAESVDEMKSAIRADEQLAELARSVNMAKAAADIAKAQLDRAVLDYKNFRLAFVNQKLSADTAALVVDADKAAELQNRIDFDVAKKQVEGDKAARDKAAADAAAKAGHDFHTVAEKKRALEAQVTACKNKIAAAERLREQGQRDMQAARDLANNRNYRESGRDGTQTWAGNGVVYSNANELAAAQAKIDQADKDARDAQMAYVKAQQDLNAIAGDVNAAEAAKKTADAAAPVAAAKTKVVAVYMLNDGSNVEALSSMQSGDEYIVKTDAGMKTLKKSDVKDVRYPQQ